MSNQRLKERQARKRDLQAWHLMHARALPVEGDSRLRATTVRAAKQQGKRLFPNGCKITGYIVETIELLPNFTRTEETEVYECIILPEHKKQPGSRRAISSRHDFYRNHIHGHKRPPVQWTKPEFFRVSLYN